MDESPQTRMRVHALIDQLPPSQIAALEALLQSMINPLLTPPIDEFDELIRPDWESGSGFTFDQLVEECGVNPVQIRDVQSERGTVRKIRFEPSAPADPDLE